MPWITRCSLNEIQSGNHINPDNCILIQIVDICREFPKPRYYHLFKQIYQFEFMDMEVEDEDSDLLGINEFQALDISKIISNAYKDSSNILVHCIAGVCRSGGVCEAAESIGFEYIRPDKINSPNLMVKSKITKYLRGGDELY